VFYLVLICLRSDKLKTPLATTPPTTNTQQDAGLPVALLVMLHRAADAAAAASPQPPAGAAKPQPKGRGAAAAKKRAEAEAAAAAAAQRAQREGEAGGGEQSEADWLPELAAALCDQVRGAVCVPCVPCVLCIAMCVLNQCGR